MNRLNKILKLSLLSLALLNMSSVSANGNNDISASEVSNQVEDVVQNSTIKAPAKLGVDFNNTVIINWSGEDNYYLGYYLKKFGNGRVVYIDASLNGKYQLKHGDKIISKLPYTKNRFVIVGHGLIEDELLNGYEVQFGDRSANKAADDFKDLLSKLEKDYGLEKINVQYINLKGCNLATDYAFIDKKFLPTFSASINDTYKGAIVSGKKGIQTFNRFYSVVEPHPIYFKDYMDNHHYNETISKRNQPQPPRYTEIESWYAGIHYKIDYGTQTNKETMTTLMETPIYKDMMEDYAYLVKHKDEYMNSLKELADYQKQYSGSNSTQMSKKIDPKVIDPKMIDPKVLMYRNAYRTFDDNYSFISALLLPDIPDEWGISHSRDWRNEGETYFLSEYFTNKHPLYNDPDSNFKKYHEHFKKNDVSIKGVNRFMYAHEAYKKFFQNGREMTFAETKQYLNDKLGNPRSSNFKTEANPRSEVPNRPLFDAQAAEADEAARVAEATNADLRRMPSLAPLEDWEPTPNPEQALRKSVLNMSSVSADETDDIEAVLNRAMEAEPRGIQEREIRIQEIDHRLEEIRAEIARMQEMAGDADSFASTSSSSLPSSASLRGLDTNADAHLKKPHRTAPAPPWRSIESIESIESNANPSVIASTKSSVPKEDAVNLPWKTRLAGFLIDFFPGAVGLMITVPDYMNIMKDRDQALTVRESNLQNHKLMLESIALGLEGVDLVASYLLSSVISGPAGIATAFAGLGLMAIYKAIENRAQKIDNATEIQLNANHEYFMYKYYLNQKNEMINPSLEKINVLSFEQNPYTKVTDIDLRNNKVKVNIESTLSFTYNDKNNKKVSWKSASQVWRKYKSQWNEYNSFTKDKYDRDNNFRPRVPNDKPYNTADQYELDIAKHMLIKQKDPSNILETKQNKFNMLVLPVSLDNYIVYQGNKVLDQKYITHKNTNLGRTVMRQIERSLGLSVKEMISSAASLDMFNHLRSTLNKNDPGVFQEMLARQESKVSVHMPKRPFTVSLQPAVPLVLDSNYNINNDHTKVPAINFMYYKLNSVYKDISYELSLENAFALENDTHLKVKLEGVGSWHIRAEKNQVELNEAKKQLIVKQDENHTLTVDVESFKGYVTFVDNNENFTIYDDKKDSIVSLTKEEYASEYEKLNALYGSQSNYVKSIKSIMEQSLEQAKQHVQEDITDKPLNLFLSNWAWENVKIRVTTTDNGTFDLMARDSATSLFRFRYSINQIVKLQFASSKRGFDNDDFKHTIDGSMLKTMVIDKSTLPQICLDVQESKGLLVQLVPCNTKNNAEANIAYKALKLTFGDKEIEIPSGERFFGYEEHKDTQDDQDDQLDEEDYKTLHLWNSDKENNFNISLSYTYNNRRYVLLEQETLKAYNGFGFNLSFSEHLAMNPICLQDKKGFANTIIFLNTNQACKERADGTLMKNLLKARSQSRMLIKIPKGAKIEGFHASFKNKYFGKRGIGKHYEIVRQNIMKELNSHENSSKDELYVSIGYNLFDKIYLKTLKDEKEALKEAYDIYSKRLE